LTAGAIRILHARSSALAALSFAAIIALAWFAFAPGLSGGFLFDDFANLPSLGAYGRIDNFDAFLRYITSGGADPTGRPLALLSFLIDARDWPADPWPFKRTNVVLHLLNGVLLAWLLSMLGRALDRRDDPDATASTTSRWAAVLGAALWILHPLFLSTTLYVVQREAMLPATFVLFGLIGYTAGRERTTHDRGGGGALAAASIAGCTLLGVLCKANGALLPLLALIVEYTILGTASPLPRTPRATRFAMMRRLLVVLPSLLLIAWLIYSGVRGLVAGPGPLRPWSLGERLLTEPRVLVDYLALLWLPRSYSRGLFNDGYEPSTGLLSPPATAIAIILLTAVIVFAIRKRRAHPAVALAILFYFGGQLLESTVLPLELYFEHRNYVPALPMFWPLALWLCAPRRSGTNGSGEESASLASIRLALAVTLPILFAALTFVGASLWGNVADQALVWASRNPDSPRAQANAAQIEITRGHAHEAVVRLDKALSAKPDEMQLALNLVDAECAAGTRPEFDRAAMSLRTTRRLGHLAHDWLADKLAALESKPCKDFDLEALERLVNAMAANPQLATMPGRKQDVLNLRGSIALARADPQGALRYFDEAFDADPTYASALAQAAMLGAGGHPDLGLAHVNRLDAARANFHKPAFGMPAIHAWLLQRQGYWPREVAHLRDALADEARHLPQPAP
jgi:protein O-mannosyl-transferase